jgi:hypothetical protein
MRSNRSDLGFYIRRLAWAAPVLAAWQGGCVFGPFDDDEEDNYPRCNTSSERQEEAVPLKFADAGPPPTTAEECATFCRQNVGYGSDYECRNETDDRGMVGVVVCSFKVTCIGGRRPAGFEPPAIAQRGPLLGRYLAGVAAAEAASVDAFEHLAELLALHGLDPELGRRARRAAADEERHYRMTAALARKFGVTAQRGSVSAPVARSLFELAADNVREGVVVETFGAALAWWQAAHAGERRVRRMMERIAADETEHAVLSWDVDCALRARLSAGERAWLDGVMADTLAEFEKEITEIPPEELVLRAGLPSRQVAAAMFAEVRKVLYS